MDTFAEIRPYNDHEVRPVLERLLANRELIGIVARFRFAVLPRWLQSLLSPLVRLALRRQLAAVDDVRSFQMVIEKYMSRMIATTTDGFTVSGLERLDAATPRLFMSNHRDIAMDPAFVNYSLYCNGHDTVRIAIGDNLLKRDYAADLMRLNKSFIVKRSAKGPRQMLAAYRQLSGYIRHCLRDEQVPVWIAQREGRAKDGRDRTEPAIIKMLAMARDKADESLAGYMASLNIMPVAISYEFDPCDANKAHELRLTAETGGYEKSEAEDVQSIARGIAGYKGHVHVAYGEPLADGLDSPEAIAAEIDRQVISLYVLHPTNFIACKLLHGEYPIGSYGAGARPFDPAEHREVERRFEQRLAALPEADRPWVLAMYANCIEQKLALGVMR